MNTTTVVTVICSPILKPVTLNNALHYRTNGQSD